MTAGTRPIHCATLKGTQGIAWAWQRELYVRGRVEIGGVQKIYTSVVTAPSVRTYPLPSLNVTQQRIHIVAYCRPGRDSENKTKLKSFKYETRRLMEELAHNGAMAYVAGFKRAFAVQDNGTLRCDRGVRVSAPGWWVVNPDDYESRATSFGAVRSHLVYTWFTPGFTWFTPGLHLVYTWSSHQFWCCPNQRPGPGSDNIATTNRNKTEMVYAYVYAFIVIQRICKSLRLELWPYTSKIVGVDVGGSKYAAMILRLGGWVGGVSQIG
jgi:hypothetical protein